MNKFYIVLISFFLCLNTFSTDNQSQSSKVFGLVIHGGAGTINRKNLDFTLEEEYREKLKEALNAGYKILENNGNAVDAVEAAINIMENSPLFNAGKGAVFTNTESNELDSSIMEGKNLNAGAVAGVKHVKNPISLAIKVMNNSEHVMLTGAGAEHFAVQQGIKLVPESYFFTEKRMKQLKKIKGKDISTFKSSVNDNHKFGTVGAVALDQSGNIAAGTSTGGMTNKKFGRVGDSPIIGAGTYADNSTCGVSSTGWGEFFIRTLAAYDISAQMKYKNISVKRAADSTIDKIQKLGGFGGVIALDRNGNYTFSFNTKGMYRGVYLSNSKAYVKIFENE